MSAGLIEASPDERFHVRFDADGDAMVFRRFPGNEGWLRVIPECPVSMDDRISEDEPDRARKSRVFSFEEMRRTNGCWMVKGFLKDDSRVSVVIKPKPAKD